MISNSLIKTGGVTFRSEQDPLGGAAFQPQRKIKSMEEHHAPTDRILRLNPFEKFGLGVKKFTVDIPKSIVRGLQGDKSVSFHEVLTMSAVPYYLGGLGLYNCF